MMFKFKSGALLLLIAALSLTPALRVQAADLGGQDGEDAADEPPPEGYEERTYPVSDLIADLQDFSKFGENNPQMVAFDSGKHVSSRPRLGFNEIMQVLKVCAAPESWNKHGAARISTMDSALVILQKPEVHEEIVKVLAWLREGAMAPFHSTLVAVKLSPEQVIKLAQNPTAMGSPELLKLITDAGADAASQIVDVNGYEGQNVSVLAGGRFRYIHDLDVAGAAYDPVLQQRLTGLRLSVTVFRSPDCKDLQMEFNAALDRNITMNTGHITVALEGVQTDPPAPPANDKKDEKPPVVVQVPGQLRPVVGSRPRQPNIDLPTGTAAALHSTIGVPQGKFGFVGTLDLGLCNADGKPELIAFFARATVGGEGVPSLTGVSGLKADEIFRLYPTQSITRTVPSFPSRNVSGIAMEGLDSGLVNAFSSVPAAADNPSLRKAKTLFQEQVRKDKLVEPLGPVIFTRLKEPDHQKLAATLTSDFQRRYMPLKAHVVAISVAPDKARKVLLDGSPTYDWAAIAELAGAPGSRMMMNEAFGLLNQQRTSVFAGIKSNIIADYDINGDSYDPVIFSVMDRGFVLDVCPTRGSDKKNFDVLLHFQLVPQLNAHDHKFVEGFAVNSGAMMNLVMNMVADIDLPKPQVVDMHEQVNVQAGQYVLAGSATLTPEEEKAEPRQTLLFIRLDDAK